MRAVRQAFLVAALGLGCVLPVQAAYWSLFNTEGENVASSVYVTYDTLSDMLSDTNRIGTFFPNGGGAGRNVVGSGSDAMRIVSPVPVPATLTLLGIGLAGLGFARRRKAQ